MTAGDAMYFVMTGEGLHPGTAIGTGPSSATGPWYDGQPNTERIRTPLKYTLDRYAKGEVLPYYHEWEIPLMRHDLVEVLRAAGVDNLELYPATVRIPWTKEVRSDFWAVNVIGLVDALPRTAGESGGIYTGVTLDHTNPGGLLLFRLRQSCEAVVVHRRVRAAITEAGIRGLTFYEDGEWSTA